MTSSIQTFQCFYKESSCGVGDFLRGSCFLFEALSSVSRHFDIDLTFHPIGKYFNNPSIVQYEKGHILDAERLAKDKPDKYLESLLAETQRILNLKQDNIFLFSNYSDAIFLSPEDYQKINVSKDCQNFMKSRLQFTRQITDYADNIVQNKKYNLVHFRCGDFELVKAPKSEGINNKNYHIDYEQCLDFVNNIENPIVLSDSNGLKTYLQNNGVNILHSKSQHSSCNPGFIKDMEYEEDLMFYVALDMNLISRSSSIYSYSVYPWGSGFVFWLAKIFNIPILTTRIGV